MHLNLEMAFVAAPLLLGIGIAALRNNYWQTHCLTQHRFVWQDDSELCLGVLAHCSLTMTPVAWQAKGVAEAIADSVVF